MKVQHAIACFVLKEENSDQQKYEILFTKDALLIFFVDLWKKLQLLLNVTRDFFNIQIYEPGFEEVGVLSGF